MSPGASVRVGDGAVALAPRAYAAPTLFPASLPPASSFAPDECASRGIAHASLPANDRPQAELTVLDITKWFGETSGGVRTYLTEKARYVAAREALRQVLVVPGPRDSWSLGDGVRTYRLRGPVIPTQTAYRFLFATRSTRRVVEHERPDVIEVGSPFFVPWVTAIASRRLRAPMVAFHHTSLATMPRALGLGPAAGRLWMGVSGAYLRGLHRLFRLTVVASDFAGEELRAVGIEHVRQVPLGVDLAHFHPQRKRQRDRTRRRFGLPLDRPVALYVGRLAREKRLEVVLDGWRDVARASGAILVVVGSGEEEGGLRARARGLEVLWLPFQGDREVVARLHGCADVYLSPGEWETFGLAALEAMATGVPVVTPGCGGGWELVSRAGAGRAYEPGSPGDMARAVIATMEECDGASGEAGRRYAEREHGWSTVFDRLFTMYREVVAV